MNMKLPGRDLVALEAGCCGVKCAHVFYEGLCDGRRYVQQFPGHWPKMGIQAGIANRQAGPRSSSATPLPPP